MKVPMSCLRLAIYFASLVASSLAVYAGTPTIEIFARLGGTRDGYHAKAAPIQGPDGNFYGTTEAGGPANCGTIYRLAADGTFTTIYTFKDTGDGSNPVAGLVLGPDGNFYGTTTTTTGGHGQGTVFRVTATGVLTTIYNFSTVDSNSANADGADPVAALLLGADGNLYGTTMTGGTNGGGTVFQITPAGALTTLYSFASPKFTDASTQGFFKPQTSLAQGADGNFYGTAQGVVYKLTPAGVATLLYQFTGQADGAFPGPLLLGADGNFYGLTGYDITGYDRSTAFRITPAGVLTTLHTFDPNVEGDNAGHVSASGGDAPAVAPPLIQGTDGNFYGTTRFGGYTGFIGGTVFRMTPAGAVTVLYTFALTSDGGGMAIQARIRMGTTRLEWFRARTATSTVSRRLVAAPPATAPAPRWAAARFSNSRRRAV